MKLSIIIPVYNEEDNVKVIYEKIKSSFSTLLYEIIFVNDGSVDRTMDSLKSVYLEDRKHVKVLNFTRNFGKDAAIYAGLSKASGEYIGIIDADMQQDPLLFNSMLNFLEDNAIYDQVAMINKNRKNSGIIKRIGGKLFYKVINHLSEIHFSEDASDFRLFRRNVLKVILDIKEKNRFSKGIFNWVGFNTYYMDYEPKKRLHGKSKFNFINSCKYALDGIFNYSTKLLSIPFYLGLMSFFGGLIYLLIKLILNKVDNYIITLSVIFFMSGIILMCLGILGIYLSKIFVEVKNRPIYILKSKWGFNNEKET